MKNFIKISAPKSTLNDAHSTQKPQFPQLGTSEPIFQQIVVDNFSLEKFHSAEEKVLTSLNVLFKPKQFLKLRG